MGKVTVVSKSRKEYTCDKCHKVIPSGSKYYRGDLNFSRPIIRCAECGLESWEVTTSDYQLRVGEVVCKWAENYSPDEDGVSNIVAELESIRDDLQDRLDNMPEGLQYGDTGQLLQDRIDSLENAISDLESIDGESLKQDVINEYDYTDDDADSDWDENEDDDEDEDGISSDADDDDEEWDEENEQFQEALEEKFTEEIEAALSEIDF